MRKKIFMVIILIVSIILVLLNVKPLRTTKEMEKIAKSELMEEPLSLFTDNYDYKYKGIVGPIVFDRGEKVEYTWYKILEWGDTATISAFVYKNFINEYLGIFRSQNQPSATADLKWYYVYEPEGISKFNDLLFHTHNRKTIDVSRSKLSARQNSISDSLRFVVQPERLLFFLKKGHFQIVEKQNGFTVVDFYQNIAKKTNSNGNSFKLTKSAKIFINDSLEVFILPISIGSSPYYGAF